MALIALFKQQWKDEEEAATNANSEEEEEGQNSEASLEALFANTNPYYPYNQELFGHDEASTLDLGRINTVSTSSQNYQNNAPAKTALRLQIPC